MTYRDRLLDPRWQKKRLEIMDRDGFKCGYCPNTHITLHVHHKYYLPNADPWDYPNEALITLCENCHIIEEELKSCQGDFIRMLQKIGFLNAHFEQCATRGKMLDFKDVYSFFSLGDNKLFLDEFRTLVSKHRQFLIDNPIDLPF